MSQIEILLVEDSEADIDLVKIAFDGKIFPCTLHTAYNGLEALDYLHKQGKFSNAAKPDVILLDLNMPQMDGKQLLAMLREDEILCKIPVIMLTSSQAAHDIQECYQLRANCYIVKPGSFKEYTAMATQVRNFLEHAAEAC